MRLIDIEPFETFSPVIRFSYTGNDDMIHTIIAPTREIPTYGTPSRMPEYLGRAFSCSAGATAGPPAGVTEIPITVPYASIEELDLSVRSHNCLMRAGIGTVAELTKFSASELARIRNMGRVSLREIEEKLSALGLSLAPEKT